MTNSNGYRSGTRSKFAKGFRQHGMPTISRCLAVYKRGDYVTIKTDGAIQKGMPHSFYHGRTGVVYNVTRRGLGVAIPKRIGNREILKRICIRAEHVFKSRCREAHQKRCAENDRLRKEHKASGSTEKLVLKRQPAGPRGATHIPKAAEIKWLSPIPFEEHF